MSTHGGLKRRPLYSSCRRNHSFAGNIGSWTDVIVKHQRAEVIPECRVIVEIIRSESHQLLLTLAREALQSSHILARHGGIDQHRGWFAQRDAASSSHR